MAADILKYYRPVVSSSSWTNKNFPDPDGQLSEKVRIKAIKLPNAEILHIYMRIYKCT